MQSFGLLTILVKFIINLRKIQTLLMRSLFIRFEIKRGFLGNKTLLQKSLNPISPSLKKYMD